MAVYCISYDLKSDKYESLINAIKSYGSWWHQSESTWFIDSTEGPKQILDNLISILENRDKIIVIQVQERWWAAGHTDDEYKWMKERKF